jgi:hypothetical protein
MFRQRRKKRFEELERVRELTHGQSSRSLEAHLRFYKILDSWAGAKHLTHNFITAYEKCIFDAKNKEPKPQVKKVNTHHIKKLLGQLNNLDGTVLKEVVEVGILNPKFRTALQTQKTNQGIKVGGYLIKINYGGKRQSYDIIRISDKKDVVLDVKLYEMAFCLVNYLNEGVLATDPRMVGLHKLYSEYLTYSNLASQYKRRYYDAQKEDNQAKQMQNQEDFEKNRDTALDYKGEIIDLFKKNTT